ncbi:MAG: A/G-specific adenine glycosylase [Verrucomicrobiota bacterium]
MDQLGANIESKPLATRHPLENLEPLRNAVIRWYEEVAEDYPWRRTRDPYEILVSEIMLQQTQVATVLGKRYFERWLEKFPDVETLATAEEAEILKAWEGLGYYRRARNLQKAARAVVDEHRGTFPTTYDSILALPGVGDYTAGAVSCLAYGMPVAMVDANIARVFARWFDFDELIDSTTGKRQLQAWGEALVDPNSPEFFNSGVMELGQKHCKPRNPDCHECPVTDFCTSRSPEKLPKKKAAQSIQSVNEFAWLVRDDDRILLEQEAGKRREGLWKLPIACETEVKGRDEVLRTQYSITRYRVSLQIFRGRPDDARGTWVSLDELDTIAIAAPFRRAIDQLLEESLFS